MQMQGAFVLAVFVPGAVSSFIVAMVTHSPVSWPSALDFAQRLGAAWLIMTMWAMLGALFATILRGATLAVGLGLFFLLLEQLFASTASLSELLTNLSNALPGSNAGALAAALSSSRAHRGLRQWWEQCRLSSSTSCMWQALSCSVSCFFSSATWCEETTGL